MTPLPVNDAGPGPTDVALGNARKVLNRLFAAIFLALAIFAAAALWLRYSEAERDALRNADNLVNVLSEYLAIRLGAVEGLLFRAVAASRRIGGPEAPGREWGAILRTAISGVPGVSSLSITDAKGSIVHSTITTIIGNSWAHQAVFQQLSKGDPSRLVVEAPFSINAGDPVLIPFGRALTNPRGEFIGAAIVTLVPDQLEEFLRTFDLGQAGTVWVLLPSGRVLFRAGTAEEFGGATAIELPSLASTRDAPREGYVSGPLIPGGPDFLTAYRRSNSTSLVVAVSLAKDDFLLQWRYEAAGVLVLLAIAGALLLFVRHRIDDALLDAIETARSEPDPPA